MVDVSRDGMVEEEEDSGRRFGLGLGRSDELGRVWESGKWGILSQAEKEITISS